MAWLSKGVMEQRIEFVIEANQGRESFSALCRRYGISRPTGYLWLNRYRELGKLDGLGELSKRPHHSPFQTNRRREQAVLRLKREKRNWGARKLKVVLDKNDFGLCERTVHRILKRNGLVRDRRKQTSAKLRFERELPNQLWQMDFKGEYRKSRALVYPLTVIDDHSRFLVGLSPLENTKTETVQKTLVDIFENYGVPEAILTDHGSPWWSTHSDHGLTRLSVSLIKQGIELFYSGVGHPQTQGKVERFHRTLNEEIQWRGLPHTIRSWRNLLAEIRKEYNEERPHEALQLATPSTRYSPSERSYSPNPKAWDYPAGAIVTKVDTAGSVRFGGNQYFTSHALIGEGVQLDTYGNNLLVTYRHMTVREIDLKTGIGSPLLVSRKV